MGRLQELLPGYQGQDKALRVLTQAYLPGEGGHGEVQHPGQAGARMASAAAVRRLSRKLPVQVGYPEALSRGVAGGSREGEEGGREGLVRDRSGQEMSEGQGEWAGG